MDLETLRAMFKCFSSEELKDARSCENAFANECEIVTDVNDCTYVIRILKLQSPENAAFEAKLQERLAKAGIGTPRYLTLQSGEIVGKFKERYFAISRYIQGRVPSNVTATLVESFGYTLAKFQIALRGIPVPSSSLQWLKPANAHAQFAAYSGEYQQALAKLMQKSEELFSLELPREVIHSDFHLTNVFAENDVITTVFDLETIEYSLRILDLARTALNICVCSDMSPAEVTAHLFRGFNSGTDRVLSKEELEAFGLALMYTTAVCATWCACYDSPESARKYIENISTRLR